MGCGGCGSANERCGNGLEKIYPTTAVRYGRMRHIGEFSHSPDLRFSCGCKVVISTERGIEIGEQVSLTCHGCDKSVTREQMKAYADVSGPDSYRLKAGRILREATDADLAEWKHIEDGNFDKLQAGRRVARDLDLDMKVVDCEYLFGGERVIFYFLAEQRVDFRDLVHRLANEMQTRIEMRQVGARDEARLVADYETCGRECCCKNFLKTLKPISMGMAKIQKTTLDLSKVSGRCGRLKCCLRYEHATYEELDKTLPRMNTWIRTNHGVGQVVDRQTLTQLVKIRQVDGKFVTVVVEDVVETNVAPPAPLPERVERGNGHGRGPSRDRWQKRDGPERSQEGPSQHAAEPGERAGEGGRPRSGDEGSGRLENLETGRPQSRDPETDFGVPPGPIGSDAASDEVDVHPAGDLNDPTVQAGDGTADRVEGGSGSPGRKRRRRGRRRGRRGPGEGGSGGPGASPGGPPQGSS